jgi:hypothetical protein
MLEIDSCTGRVAQVAQYLPSKYEALNSNPSTFKKRRRKEIVILN